LHNPWKSARVVIRHGAPRGLTLPLDAVVQSGEGAVVFVQTRKGLFQPRRVQLGAETDERVAIKSGLAGSERVALSGAYLLYSELVLKKGMNPFTQREKEKGVKSSGNADDNPMAGMKM